MSPSGNIFTVVTSENTLARYKQMALDSSRVDPSSSTRAGRVAWGCTSSRYLTKIKALVNLVYISKSFITSNLSRTPKTQVIEPLNQKYKGACRLLLLCSFFIQKYKSYKIIVPLPSLMPMSLKFKMRLLASWHHYKKVLCGDGKTRRAWWLTLKCINKKVQYSYAKDMPQAMVGDRPEHLLIKSVTAIIIIYVAIRINNIETSRGNN